MSGHDMHQSGETSVLANIQSSSEEVHDQDTMDFTPDPSTYTPKAVRNNFLNIGISYFTWLKHYPVVKVSTVMFKQLCHN